MPRMRFRGYNERGNKLEFEIPPSSRRLELMSPRQSRRFLNLVIMTMGIAAAYAVTGQLGFFMALNPGNVTAVWPPSGIAFASILIFGRSASFGIWLGSFALNFLFYSSSNVSPLLAIAASACIATGSTIQALAGGYLLDRIAKKNNRQPIFGSPTDVFVFLAIAALSCSIAASIGVSTIVAAHFLSWSNFVPTWFTWWAGDLGGVIVYTPLLLSWKTVPDFLKDWRRTLEFAIFVVAISLFCFYLSSFSDIGRQHYPVLFPTFLFLLVSAWRYGVWGATITIPLVQIFIILGRKALGPLYMDSLSRSLFLLAGYLSIFSVTGLTYASVLTQWKRSKEELERTAQELELKVAERTAELTEANTKLVAARDQAIEASNIKSAFVANISHELRTPLSGILGMTELLLTTELDDSHREMLEVVADSGKALLSVVNDILDISKIEAGKIDLREEPFNPALLVQDCVKLMAAAAANKGIKLNASLDSQLPVFVRGDASRIQQMLINLIANAIKFTEHGSVNVAAELISETDSHFNIQFSVQDTGIGIAPENHGLLFKPFSQVETGSTRKYGGTGLGLAISKRFVEMMQGTIEFESELSKGSKFWFQIPFRKKVLPPIEASPDDLAGASLLLPDELISGKKILVVEDNNVVRKIVCKQLKSLRLDCGAVADGTSAIAEFKTGQYDAILLDIQLPDMNGFDVAKVIRQLENSRGVEANSGIPIIALTAGAMEGSREQALQAGLDDYLAKPAGVESISRVLSVWLAAKRTVRLNFLLQ